MKRIMPMEIKFYGPTLHIMSEHISDNAWSKVINNIFISNDSIINFDMRIKARLNQFDKIMYNL